MLNNNDLRSFMNEFMRQKLFFSPEYSRYELCRFYEYFTRSQLDFGGKMELVQNVLDHGREFIETNCAVNSETNELEHVLSFKVDPVNVTQWGEFISNF